MLAYPPAAARRQGKETRLFAIPFYILKRSFYQDKLGTNIAKTLKKRDAFLQGDVADGSAPSKPKDYWFPDSLDQVPLHAWAAAQQPLPDPAALVDGGSMIKISPDHAVGGKKTVAFLSTLFR